MPLHCVRRSNIRSPIAIRVQRNENERFFERLSTRHLNVIKPGELTLSKGFLRSQMYIKAKVKPMSTVADRFFRFGKTKIIFSAEAMRELHLFHQQGARNLRRLLPDQHGVIHCWNLTGVYELDEPPYVEVGFESHEGHEYAIRLFKDERAETVTFMARGCRRVSPGSDYCARPPVHLQYPPLQPEIIEGGELLDDRKSSHTEAMGDEKFLCISLRHQYIKDRLFLHVQIDVTPFDCPTRTKRPLGDSPREDEPKQRRI